MAGNSINPSMVVLARESRGWTQRALAEAIGVGQPTISRYELGTLAIPEDDGKRIAEALLFDFSLLTQSDPVHAVGASLIYRQKSGVKVGQQRQIEAEINIRKMQVARLVRGATIDCDHVFPSLPVEGFGDNPEAVAKELRKILRIPEGPIRDLTQIVETAGAIVIQMDFGTRLVDGASLWVLGLPPLFFMNKNAPGERYRFSLAHEIGHVVMHRAVRGEEVEDEANAFASEFLMPRHRVRRDLRNFNLDTAQRLKPVWGTSMQALIERAYNLNVISNAQRRRLFTRISARGHRIEEPLPLPLETARSFDRLVRVHREELGMSEDEMRQILFANTLGPIEPGSIPRLRLVGEGSLFSSYS